MTQEIENADKMRKITKEEGESLLKTFDPPHGILMGRPRRKLPHVVFGFITRMREGYVDEKASKDRFGNLPRSVRTVFKFTRHCLPLDGVHADVHTINTYLGKGYRLLDCYIPDDEKVLDYYQDEKGFNRLKQIKEYADGVILKQDSKSINEALTTENQRLTKEVETKKAKIAK